MTPRLPAALIVDDDFMFVMHVSAILNDESFRPIEMSNAAQALTLLEAEGGGIPAMIVDIDMEGMNGLELSQLVYNRWPEIKIMIVSGHVSPDLSDIPPGAAFFHKPIDIDAVRSFLRSVR